MKKSIQLIAFTAILLCTSLSQAQVSVNINIGAQPLWGPVGYDYVQYYYLPDYDIYYDVPAHRYVYLDGGNWLFVSTLPPRFAHVDLYSTYKVVVNEPKAYLHYKEHKVKFAQYKGGGGHQVVIKNSDEPKYYVVKGHPHYAPSPGQMKSSPGQVKKESHGNFKPEGPKNNQPGPSHQGKDHSGPSPGGGGGGKGGGKGGGGGKGKGH